MVKMLELSLNLSILDQWKLSNTFQSIGNNDIISTRNNLPPIFNNQTLDKRRLDPIYPKTKQAKLQAHKLDWLPGD